MIHLDEHTSVTSAHDVSAIKPIRISSPIPVGTPGRPEAIIDPDACMVLIGGLWVQIDRGVPAIRKLLEAKP